MILPSISKRLTPVAVLTFCSFLFSTTTHSFGAQPSSFPVRWKKRALIGKVIPKDEQTKANIKAIRNAYAQAATAHSPSTDETSNPIKDKLLNQLRQQSGSSLTYVEPTIKNGVPHFISGSCLQPPSQLQSTGTHNANQTQDLSTAKAFLSTYGPLLQLSHPDSELHLINTKKDELGSTHLRFAQYHGDIPVWPAEASVHLNKDGNVVVFNSSHVATPTDFPDSLATANPKLDAAQAIVAAKAALPDKDAAALASIPTPPQLIIYAPRDGECRLAWKVQLDVAIAKRYTLVIDAENGTVLLEFNRVCTASEASGQGIDLFGLTVNLHLTFDSGIYQMINRSEFMFTNHTSVGSQGIIKVLDSMNQPLNNNETPTGVLVTSTSANSWPVPASVSASFVISQIYNFYLTEFKRNSLDGDGGDITAFVRVGHNLQNSFWDGTAMYFGDGAPDDIYDAGDPDTAAHELTHGVIEKTANLIYANQSGALNESYADVLAKRFSHTQKHVNFTQFNPTNDPVWGFGVPNNIRDLKIPERFNQPSHMADFRNLPDTDEGDHGGVHINSGITNHAFYLLSTGPTQGIAGIPEEEAGQIFYRALSVYLIKNSNFLDDRLACIQAAKDLYGDNSVEASTTALAFDAVGIMGPGPNPLPTPTSTHFAPVNGPDEVLFFRSLQIKDPTIAKLFRIDSKVSDPASGKRFAKGKQTLALASVSGNGKLAVFLNKNHRVCIQKTKLKNGKPAKGPKSIAAAAISRDGKQIAVVKRDSSTGNSEPRLLLVNLKNKSSRQLLLQVNYNDSAPFSTIDGIDDIQFSSDARYLLLSGVENRASASPVYKIYLYDIANQSADVLESSTNGANARYLHARFGQTTDDVITCDLLNVLDQSVQVLYIDLTTNKARIIASLLPNSVQFGIIPNFGYPQLNGDDTQVIYTIPGNSASGHSLVSQSVSSPNSPPQLFVANAELGTIYRHGHFNGPPSARLIKLKPKIKHVRIQTNPDGSKLLKVKVAISNKGKGNASPILLGFYITPGADITDSAVALGTFDVTAQLKHNTLKGKSKQLVRLFIPVPTNVAISGQHLSVFADPENILNSQNLNAASDSVLLPSP